MTVNSIKKAWEEADKLMATDYIKDEMASERARYPIYMSTLEGSMDHISDLGDRLEVTVGANTYNIWIEEDTHMANIFNITLEDIIKQAIDTNMARAAYVGYFDWIYECEIDNVRQQAMQIIDNLITAGALSEDYICEAEALIDRLVSEYCETEGIAIVDDDYEGDLTADVHNMICEMDKVVREAQRDRSEDMLKSALVSIGGLRQHLYRLAPDNWHRAIDYQLDKMVDNVNLDIDWFCR